VPGVGRSQYEAASLESPHRRGLHRLGGVLHLLPPQRPPEGRRAVLAFVTWLAGLRQRHAVVKRSTGPEHQGARYSIPGRAQIAVLLAWKRWRMGLA
jgi:hypothetical protein